MKNNNTRLTGLTIKTEESNVAPTIFHRAITAVYTLGLVAIAIIITV